MGLLDGRVALVTGIGRDLVQTAASAFADQGAAVMIGHADGEPIAGRITGGGGRADWSAADVTDFEAAGGLVMRAVETWGGLDIVLNAAFDPAAPAEATVPGEGAEAKWDAAIKTGLRSAFTVGRHASAYWRANRGGSYRLITLIPPGSLFGTSSSMTVAAAGSAVIGFTFSCANALRRYGVTANVVVPRASAGGTAEFGDVAVFLASESSHWLNGKVLAVGDGRVSLVASPEVEYELDVVDGWSRDLVLGELASAVHAAVTGVANPSWEVVA
jgi:NAD(P)-dependent dehydrogenase (short-subunit alcohol dehydrogenase family)